MLCYDSFNLFKDMLAAAPHNYLEIGIFDGDGFSQLAKMFPNKAFYGIDPFIEDGFTSMHTKMIKGDRMPVQKAVALDLVKDLNNVSLFEGTSLEFANSLTDQIIDDMDIGWVLIDGSHDYADVVVDYNLALRLIGDRHGGIVFDDLNLPGVRRAYREFLDKEANISFGINITRTYPSPVIFHPVNMGVI